jgi:hypothetical protein
MRAQVSITGQENMFSYKVTPAIIRYFCKTCGIRVYGARLDEDGTEQLLVRGGVMIMVCSA